MKMYEIEVSASPENGDVFLTQTDPTSDENHVIIIHTDQAELLCKWIMQAAKGSAE